MNSKKLKRQKGRSGSTFIQLSHFVVRSPEWCRLSGAETRMLIELAAKYNGRNNGDLSATYADLSPRGWASKDTIHRALKGLEDAGWIIKTRQGGRHVGPSLYAITWWPIDESYKHHERGTHKATHAWKKESAASRRPRVPDNRGASRAQHPRTENKIGPVRSAA